MQAGPATDLKSIKSKLSTGAFQKKNDCCSENVYKISNKKSEPRFLTSQIYLRCRSTTEHRENALKPISVMILL